MLIEAGANVNANANSGDRALLTTALFGLVKSMRLLIEAGADVNAASDEEGRTDHMGTSAELSGADPGFPVGGGVNPPGGHQHTILPNFPKNCMKLRNFWATGGGGCPPPLDLPLTILQS